MTWRRTFPAAAAAWDRATSRERALGVLAGIVVSGGAAYALLWQPMVSDLARLTRDLPAQRALAKATRAGADELPAVARLTAKSSADAKSATERVLSELALRNEVTGLEFAEGRLRLTFATVRFDALLTALDRLRSTAGLSITAMTFLPRVEAGSVRAEITLAPAPP